jgi:ribonuclease E
MANKMLIDAAHPEETRVVVVRGQRVEEFDFESAQRKPLRGNIYLAKVMRVEPSLQAAFVDYGGNRHGFLAFSEIHPDYYQIPVADREALLAEEARSARESDDDEPGPRRNRARRAAPARRNRGPSISTDVDAALEQSPLAGAAETSGEPEAGTASSLSEGETESERAQEAATAEEGAPVEAVAPAHEAALHEEVAPATEASADDEAPSREALPDENEPAEDKNEAWEEHETPEASAASDSVSFVDAASPEGSDQHGSDRESSDEDEFPAEGGAPEARQAGLENGESGAEAHEPVIEQLGAGDGLEEVPERRRPPRRNYKIQEVIKRRQILLIQVVKEERGNKGAALTTYLSLAGRYSVLMPNTARGGGISRKITNAPDRKRLKSVAQELDVPDGMGVIVRTAGAARTKAEIKRDFEYLLRLWENVRELTLKSSAPALVHEEGSLIKRAIRDLYNKDIDEILVAGDDGYKEAKDFMRMLAPSHAKVVKLDKETEPLFARFSVERQLDAMFSNIVTLRSGGYVVINQTEALVAIDVNSGRATREHNIEDTALKTNLEAAEEVARQLRLRDLAGLIVIDFIDMDEKRNNRSVEKRLKDCLKNDRARIQVGSISPFGLLEMSRQRIRSGVVEGSSTPCPHCAGAGRVRSTPSVALHVLRHVEDALVKSASRNLVVRTRTDIALYVLNQKRRHLRQIEDRFAVSVSFVADDKHNGVDLFAIELGEPVIRAGELAAPEVEAPQRAKEVELPVEEDQVEGAIEAEREHRPDGEARAPGDGSQKRRRRRRRRRGGERDAESGLQPGVAAHAEAGHRDEETDLEEADHEAGEPLERDESIAAEAAPARGAPESGGSDQPRKRRRGRRGGGRARREEGEAAAEAPYRPDRGEMGDEEAIALAHAVEDLDQPVSPPEPVETMHGGAELETRPEAPAGIAIASVSSSERHAPELEAAEPESGASEAETAPPEAAPPAEPVPVLTSTYDPARAKRAGWWSKARSALGGKE